MTINIQVKAEILNNQLKNIIVQQEKEALIINGIKASDEHPITKIACKKIYQRTAKVWAKV